MRLCWLRVLKIFFFKLFVRIENWELRLCWLRLLKKIFFNLFVREDFHFKEGEKGRTKKLYLWPIDGVGKICMIYGSFSKTLYIFLAYGVFNKGLLFRNGQQCTFDKKKNTQGKYLLYPVSHSVYWNFLGIANWFGNKEGIVGVGGIGGEGVNVGRRKICYNAVHIPLLMVMLWTFLKGFILKLNAEKEKLIWWSPMIATLKLDPSSVY